MDKTFEKHTMEILLFKVNDYVITSEPDNNSSLSEGMNNTNTYDLR